MRSGTFGVGLMSRDEGVLTPLRTISEEQFGEFVDSEIYMRTLKSMFGVNTSREVVEQVKGLMPRNETRRRRPVTVAQNVERNV